MYGGGSGEYGGGIGRVYIGWYIGRVYRGGRKGTGRVHRRGMYRGGYLKGEGIFKWGGGYLKGF